MNLLKPTSGKKIPLKQLPILNRSYMENVPHSKSSQDSIQEIQLQMGIKNCSPKISNDCFTTQLIRNRRQQSLKEVTQAFNSIRDLNNKDQINKALMMISQVKGRVELIEKMLDRRNQITQAKEMQTINNMAPLFQKIKDKFMNSVQKKRDKKLSSNQNQSAPQIIIKKSASQPDLNQQQSQAIFLDQKSTYSLNNNEIHKSQESKQSEIGNQNSGEKNKKDSKSGIGGSKNVMGAISLFATHDTQLNDKDEEQEQKARHSKVLGYLQRDNLLKVDEKLLLQRKSVSISFNSSQSQQLQQGQQIQNQMVTSQSSYSSKGSIETQTPNQNLQKKKIQQQQQRTKMNSIGDSSILRKNSSQINIDIPLPQSSFFKNSYSLDRSKCEGVSKGNRSQDPSSLHQMNISNNLSMNRLRQVSPFLKNIEPKKEQAYLYDFIMECEYKRFFNQNEKILQDTSNCNSNLNQTFVLSPPLNTFNRLYQKSALQYKKNNLVSDKYFLRGQQQSKLYKMLGNQITCSSIQKDLNNISQESNYLNYLKSCVRKD